MTYIVHIFFDILSALLQLLPQIIALIFISRIQVDFEMEKLRKKSIYIIVLTAIVPFFIRIALRSFNAYSHNIALIVNLSVEFIFIVTLICYTYNVFKYRNKRKSNLNK